jgi:5'-methylthioadenosine phosphorylase
MYSMKKVALIGGTGLEELNFLSNSKNVTVETPYGSPDSDIVTGTFNGIEVVHLARHGRGHTIPSPLVNYRANIFALKELGCSHIFSTTVCSSLREEICPGEFVIIDQFIDFTSQRSATIYEKLQEKYKCTPMASPFSDDLRDDLIEAAIVLRHTLHTKGTVVTIDGPRYSTRAESNVYKMWGADIINMSTSTEVILANELNIPIAAIALCIGYDSWRTDIKTPTQDEIHEVVENNTGKLIEIIKTALTKV